jgi:hypothetical protein
MTFSKARACHPLGRRTGPTTRFRRSTIGAPSVPGIHSRRNVTYRRILDGPSMLMTLRVRMLRCVSVGVYGRLIPVICNSRSAKRGGCSCGTATSDIESRRTGEDADGVQGQFISISISLHLHIFRHLDQHLHCFETDPSSGSIY